MPAERLRLGRSRDRRTPLTVVTVGCLLHPRVEEEKIYIQNLLYPSQPRSLTQTKKCNKVVSLGSFRT